MKNKLTILPLVLLMFALVFSSCSDDEKAPDVDPTFELTQPVVTFSGTTVVLEEDKEDETALTISWSAATEDDVNVDYKLYINLEGEDIYKGVSVERGDALTYSLTHDELNYLILHNFNANLGETVSLSALVSATDIGEVYESAVSETDEVTVTTQIPNKLYLLGGAYDAAWDFSTAPELTQGESGEYVAEGIALDFGLLEEEKGFKILLKKDSWDPFLGQDIASSEFGDMELINTGDSQFYPLKDDYTNGIYTIEVDINTMKLTMTRTGDLAIDYTKAVFMLGDGTTFGWGFDKENAMTNLGNNVHEYERVHLSADEFQGFKFFVGFENWENPYIRNTAVTDNYWSIKSADGGDAQYYLFDLNKTLVEEGEAPLPAGFYKIHIDLDNLTMEVTLVEADS